MDAAGPDYWITRLLFQRALASIYFVAFSVALNQFRPLCGEKGLEPVKPQFAAVRFWEAPGLFWFNSSDRSFLILSSLGLILSLLAMLGISESRGIYLSVAVWFSLWVIYLSFVNAGQTFYSFGWETLLLECGFLAIFLGSNDTKPPVIVIWLLRWLLFRLMFGAGLIKIRGDPCWRDLTCMVYHYETQPMPNPLSWYFHKLPLPIHKAGVLFNHVVELLVPFLYFVPGIVAAAAGLITALFQTLLIVSGNFSWLNYISLCLCIPCFNDSFFQQLFSLSLPAQLHEYLGHRIAVYVLAGLVAVLSIRPVLNLLSPGQIMNTSFDPLHLVNTYGAFGSITKVRREIIIEGTTDMIRGPDSQWLEYEFKGKPGEVTRRPPLVAPYHYRLDWQMWFAAMLPSVYDRWFLALMMKLLQGDAQTLGLLARNPFPEKPPAHVRALLYEYHFTSREERAATGAWWKRTYLGVYCPALRLERGRLSIEGEDDEM